MKVDIILPAERDTMIMKAPLRSETHSVKVIGEQESRSVLEEQGAIEVICEYCGERRSFDPVDVSKIFSDNVVSGPESIQ